MNALGVFELSPTDIDEAAVTAFTQGWCWALAVALNDETGFAVWSVTDSYGGRWHSGVMDPDTGTIIDIEGRHHTKDWVHQWRLVEPAVTGARAILGHELVYLKTTSDHQEDHAVEVARAFVPAVIAQASTAGPPEM